MTTEQPAAATDPATAQPRLLRRRATDRVLGGVASGMADYLNIDPVIVRAVFVGLLIFGGAGFWLYLIGWLLIPVEGTDDSPLVEGLRRIGPMSSSLALITFIVVSAILLVGVNEALGTGVASVFFVVILASLAIVLARLAAPRPAVAIDAEVAPTGPATTPVARPRRAAKPKAPPSPLAGLTLAAVLIAIGALALYDAATDFQATPGLYVGVALAIVGIGLVIGSWWGHAWGLVLPAILLLPFGVAAAFITAPIEGGFGNEYYSPGSATELRPEYRLTGGSVYLDLTQMENASGTIEIDASVAMGEVVIYLPPDASYEVDANLGLGGTYVAGSGEFGTDVTRTTAGGTGDLHFILDLDVGIGGIGVHIPDLNF